MSNDRRRQDLESTYREHRAHLQKVAQRIVGSPDRAEDVLQSAYLRIAAVSEQQVIEEPLRYWSQVVRHVAIDSRRRMTLESQVFADESQGQSVPASRSSPEQVAISGEYLSLIEQTLVRLPLRTRRAFSLYRLDGLTQREIAAELGVSASLVSIMISDALAALKQCRQHFEDG